MTAEQIRLNPGSNRFVLSINRGSSSLKCSLFKVVVRVIHTDEESQIARSVLQLLDEERGQ